MQKPIPTYVELVELSNGELTKCIRIAKDMVDKTRHEGQPITEKELIYQAFDNERLKRLNLAKGSPIEIPDEHIVHISRRLGISHSVGL